MTTTFKSLATAIALVLSLGACSSMSSGEQRTLSGGAIGAAGGATLGALTGGSWIAGGLIGGAVGAAAGALTNESNDLD